MSRWLSNDEREEAKLALKKVLLPPSDTNEFWQYKDGFSDAVLVKRLNAAAKGTSSKGVWTQAKLDKIRTDHFGKLRPCVPPELVARRNATRKANGTLGKNGYDTDPTPAPEPARAAPDAAGMFWERLDKISLDVAEVAKDLVEHRKNNAAMLGEQMDLLTKLAAAWGVKPDAH